MKFLIALLLLGTFAFAQEGTKPQIKKVDVRGVDEKAPVTKAEAAAVFTRARKVIRMTRIANIPGAPTIAESAKPITRDEVIAEFSKILDQSRSAIKLVPRRVKFDASEIKALSANSKAAVQKLIAWGFVAPMGPLATGPGPNMTTRDFGESVGFFLSRLADVTHMPSIKWSPYLQFSG